MQHVVKCLMRVFGHARHLAEKIMFEAHNLGRAVAEVEEKEKAQLHKDQLQSCGLTAAIEKVAFGCFAVKEFTEAVAATGLNQLLVVGIEAHVCVWQTAADLLARGYEVEVAADAVSSRTAFNRHIPRSGSLKALTHPVPPPR
jgi:nicotinamidase-related amidase